MFIKNKKGFTLAEILIVVTILGIMSAVLITRYSRSGLTVSHLGERDRVADTLMYAHNLARTNRQDVSFTFSSSTYNIKVGGNTEFEYPMLQGVALRARGSNESESSLIAIDEIKFHSDGSIDMYWSGASVSSANVKAIVYIESSALSNKSSKIYIRRLTGKVKVD